MNILHSNTYIQCEISTGYDKYIVDDVLCLFTTCLRFNTIHARREIIPLDGRLDGRNKKENPFCRESSNEKGSAHVETLGRQSRRETWCLKVHLQQLWTVWLSGHVVLDSVGVRLTSSLCSTCTAFGFLQYSR